MKPKIFTEIAALCSAAFLVTLAGCLSDEQTEELRDAAHSAILEYVENQGQEKALEYIDKLVAEGKLGSANAEKIKAAIPLGIEKLREVMGELDVLYMTRVQKERFLDEEEFDRLKDSFVLDRAKLSAAKERMAILHPLPRVNEILKEVDADPRAAYFRQVENGKFVRMALICRLLEWRDDPSHGMPERSDTAEAAGCTCSNRNCISNMENVEPRFRRGESGELRCLYCDSKVK